MQQGELLRLISRKRLSMPVFTRSPAGAAAGLIGLDFSSESGATIETNPAAAALCLPPRRLTIYRLCCRTTQQVQLPLLKKDFGYLATSSDGGAYLVFRGQRCLGLFLSAFPSSACLGLGEHLKIDDVSPRTNSPTCNVDYPSFPVSRGEKGSRRAVKVEERSSTSRAGTLKRPDAI